VFSCPYLHQMLTDFKNSFTGKMTSHKFVTSANGSKISGIELELSVNEVVISGVMYT